MVQGAGVDGIGAEDWEGWITGSRATERNLLAGSKVIVSLLFQKNLPFRISRLLCTGTSPIQKHWVAADGLMKYRPSAKVI
jgi:hypothetical protein